jgi:DNA polymerase III sliding clamp (beta) subunit (PCNA family)
MKVTIKTLSKALEYVCKCSDKRDETFKYIRMKSDLSSLIIKSVNASMQLTAHINIDENDSKEWDIVIQPFMLREIITKLPSSEPGLELNIKNGYLILNTCSYGTYKIQIDDLDNFCDSSRFNVDGVKFYPVSSTIINNIASFSAKYVSKDETKRVLTGIHFNLDTDKDTITAYATNGHFLSRLTQPLLNNNEKQAFIPCTVPKNILDLINSFSSGYELDLAFNHDEGLLYCKTSYDGYALELVGNLNEGIYPDLERLIENPTKMDITYTISPTELVSAIKALTTYEKSHIIISDDIPKQKLILESSSEIGTGRHEIQCIIQNLTEKKDDAPELKLRMGIDPNYFSSICKDYSHYESVTISRGIAPRKLTFTQQDSAGYQQYLSLLMLIQLKE